MAKMSSELELRDGFSKTFNKFNTGIDKIVSAMNNAEASSDSVDFDMPKVSSSAKKAAENIEDAGKKVDNLNNKSVDKINTGFNGLSKTIITVNQGLDLAKRLFAGLSSFMGKVDERTAVDARLSLIKDEMHTQEQLETQIMRIADLTRSTYEDTADLVAKIGRQDIFKGQNNKAMEFASNINKSFVISGASVEEMSGSVRQLTQALASGVLRGDEFNSVMEGAPVLAEMIATQLDVTKGQMREMAAEGVLTAETVTNAVLSSTDEIDKMFLQIPMTFGQGMNIVHNHLSNLLNDLSQPGEAINNLMNKFYDFISWLDTADGHQFIDGLTMGLGFVIDSLVVVFSIIGKVYNFFANNWTLIEPIIVGISTAVGLAVVALTSYKIILGIITGVQAIATAASMLKTGATIAETAAQCGLNAALMACPITWIILAIVALIAILVAVTLYIIKLWKTNINFKVGVIGIWNSILNFFDKIPVFFMKVGYGIADAFSYAKQYSLLAIQKLANGAIDTINWVIKKLNKLPGVSIDFINDATFGTEVALEEEAKRQQRAAKIAEAENKVAEKAAQREAKLQADEEKWRKQAEEQETQAQDQGNTDTDLYGNEDNGVYVNGGKLDSPIDLSTQTLKYLNDIAEKQALQQLDTLYVANDDVTLSQSDSDLLSSQTGSKANVYYLQYQGGVNMQTEVTQGDTWETIKKKAKEETDSELEIGLSDLDKVVCPS